MRIISGSWCSISWKSTCTSWWFAIFTWENENLHDKTEYVIHIRNLKHTLNHGLVLKKYIELLHLIKKLGLKPYIKHGSKKKKQQTVSKYISLSWWIMQFLEKM